MSGRFKKISHKLPQVVFTLKFRLMTLITIILILVVGTPLLFLISELDKNYREFTTNMMETTSQVVYQAIFDGMMRNDRGSIQTTVEFLCYEPFIKLIRIYRPEGTILFSSRKSELQQNIRTLADERDVPGASLTSEESFYKVGNLFSHHHLIYVQKECTPCHQNQGSVIAIMDVRIGLSPSEELYASAKKLTIFSSIIIVLILWVVLNFLYQGQIDSRLKMIINGFNELGKGNFNFQIRMPGRHELAQMAQKFNAMVKKLKTAKEKENQFLMESLARADRLVTLGEVAAEIAHEVNNPASIILTRAEFLRDELQSWPGETYCKDDLEIIIQQTEKIAEITRSILHYARKLPQTYSELDLKDVISHSAKILDPRIRQKNVTLEIISNCTHATILGNFNQLEQVFCNLINNSLDVLESRDARITIHLEKMAADSNATRYKITYRDTGPGIPAEYREKIFSPFFTTKPDGKGTGLGLFIVRNIIENHKGKIWLSEKKQPGAEFIIEMEGIDDGN